MTWSCFVDAVNVVSQITTTIVAGFGAWIAYQTLLKTPVQEPEPEEAATTGKEVLVPENVKVFQTKNQETWLKVSDDGLECYLEDRRPGKRSGLQWRLTKQQAGEILCNRDFRVYPGYRLNSGVFSIGVRRNWLYSKKLYPEPALLESEIENLLQNASRQQGAAAADQPATRLVRG